MQALERVSDRIFTVSELTRNVKNLLEAEFPAVWVTGEISNFRAATSGHFYFSLKDEKAQISIVMFRGTSRGLKFGPEDGLEVLVNGRLTVYEVRGQYQIVAEYIEPKGIGALQLAFEQLKKKLEAEGLFDPARKRPIPYLPRKIALVTSPTGAVVRDMIDILTRRFSNIEILIAPVAVQGEAAAGQITAALTELNERGDIDVLIVARGGGSIEDLWPFNEESVARAIHDSRIPVISAVGHETDVTIADFVADLRAPTPSAAAELAVPVKEDLVHTLEEERHRLIRAVADFIERHRLQLSELRGRLKSPQQILEGYLIRLDHLAEKLTWLLKNRLTGVQEKMKNLAQQLKSLSPLAILERGYAVVTKSGSTKPLTQPGSLKKWDELDVRLAHGKLTAAVIQKG